MRTLVFFLTVAFGIAFLVAVAFMFGAMVTAPLPPSSP